MDFPRFLALALAGSVAAVGAIDTVDVDLTQYVGHWYQMYGDAFVFGTFERNAVCATADYSLNDDGTVAVLNSERVGSPDGPNSNITATAVYTGKPGKFAVTFDSNGAPFPVPYWVVALGPVNDGEYQYSVVSDPLQTSLFVLARDPDDFKAKYDSEVLEMLADMGFDGKLNTPIELLQDGCWDDAAEVERSESGKPACMPAHAVAGGVCAGACIPRAGAWVSLPLGLTLGSCQDAGFPELVPASGTSASDMGGSFASLAQSLDVTLYQPKSSSCAAVYPLADLNLTEYLRATWYSQQQQLNDYQPEEDLYCAAATYDLEGATVPFFRGTVVSVYNYAVENSVDGEPVNTANGTVLCARLEDPSTTGALSVAPCFLPNVAAGPYWVLAVGEAEDGTYDWAVISGGQPTVEYDDGCTTSLDGVNNAGLWIFTREPVGKAEDIQAARDALTSMGFTLSQLLDVPQDGCSYNEAFIKDN